MTNAFGKARLYDPGNDGSGERIGRSCLTSDWRVECLFNKKLSCLLGFHYLAIKVRKLVP